VKNSYEDARVWVYMQEEKNEYFSNKVGYPQHMKDKNTQCHQWRRSGPLFLVIFIFVVPVVLVFIRSFTVCGIIAGVWGTGASVQSPSNLYEREYG
jgi:hypothetical protein